MPCERSGGSSASRSAASSGDISSSTSATFSSGIFSTSETCRSVSTSSRVSASCSRFRLSRNSSPSACERSVRISARSAGCKSARLSAGTRKRMNGSRRSSSTNSQDMLFCRAGLPSRREKAGCRLRQPQPAQHTLHPDIDISHHHMSVDAHQLNIIDAHHSGAIRVDDLFIQTSSTRKKSPSAGE